MIVRNLFQDANPIVTPETVLSRQLRENKMQQFHAVARKAMMELMKDDRESVHSATLDWEADANKRKKRLKNEPERHRMNYPASVSNISLPPPGIENDEYRELLRPSCT